jgi:hypothetical protein
MRWHDARHIIEKAAILFDHLLKRRQEAGHVIHAHDQNVVKSRRLYLADPAQLAAGSAVAS